VVFLYKCDELSGMNVFACWDHNDFFLQKYGLNASPWRASGFFRRKKIIKDIFIRIKE
jgi:hypothetical protein